ncbi:MAG: cytochrome c oxidase assembly protein [Rickettsiales bacterium]|nr:cytochrome c oxidase assembly protein [Rickettsiales bacterium]
MSDQPDNQSKRNQSTALSLVMIVAGMAMLSYAAVPLYDLFCKVTGFGGTTQASAALPDHVIDREFVISFNTDIDQNLPWKFKALQQSIRVKGGENVLVAFEAENLLDTPTKGTATYNVTPFEAGAYFNKMQCFCFEEQTLPPKTVVNMPVSFFIDPEIADDPQLEGVKHITLSYTFFSELSKN